MKRRPKYISPDGIDWRDPAMPVIRDYLMPNGEHKTVVDADYEHRYRKMLMEREEADVWK